MKHFILGIGDKMQATKGARAPAAGVEEGQYGTMDSKWNFNSSSFVNFYMLDWYVFFRCCRQNKSYWC